LSPPEIYQLWEALERAPVQRRSTKGLARGERTVSEADIPMTRAIALALKLALVTAQRIGEVTCTALSELEIKRTNPFGRSPATGRRTADRIEYHCPPWRSD
jgi:hypothetical protein